MCLLLCQACFVTLNPHKITGLCIGHQFGFIGLVLITLNIVNILCAFLLFSHLSRWGQKHKKNKNDFVRLLAEFQYQVAQQLALVLQNNI
jgi:hypothetical protein